MNIYVETNFVLELALDQEQRESCEHILSLCEKGKAQLIIPAYSFAEPYEMLRRHHEERKRLKKALDRELQQLIRTELYRSRLSDLQSLTTLLIDSADDEAKRFDATRSRLLKISEVIPLTAQILGEVARNQKVHALSPQDALVYTSVLQHLKQGVSAQGCFLNKDSKDFDNPDIVEELSTYNCKLLPRFDSGYEFILHSISQASPLRP